MFEVGGQSRNAARRSAGRPRLDDSGYPQSYESSPVGSRTGWRTPHGNRPERYSGRAEPPAPQRATEGVRREPAPRQSVGIDQPSTDTPTRTAAANRSASSNTAARSASPSPGHITAKRSRSGSDCPPRPTVSACLKSLPTVAAALSAARDGSCPLVGSPQLTVVESVATRSHPLGIESSADHRRAPPLTRRLAPCHALRLVQSHLK
jgi:hypothetical protein